MLNLKPHARRAEESKAHFHSFFGFEEKEQSIIEKNMVNILNSCIFCWNHSDFFTWSDYNFSRSGIFGFYEEDIKKIQKKLFVGQELIEPQDRDHVGQNNQRSKSLDDILH